MFHVAGHLVPTTLIPSDRVGPEVVSQCGKSSFIGIIPVSDQDVIIGKVTLYFDSKGKSFLVGDIVDVPPTNAQDHLNLNKLMKELGPKVYKARFVFPWKTQLLFVE